MRIVKASPEAPVLADDAENMTPEMIIRTMFAPVRSKITENKDGTYTFRMWNKVFRRVEKLTVRIVPHAEWGKAVRVESRETIREYVHGDAEAGLGTGDDQRTDGTNRKP